MSHGRQRMDLQSQMVGSWEDSVANTESTIHQITPYIGKTKSSIARTLVSNFTKDSDTILDPFCGSGTIAFEAWSAGRNVVANDLSPYAYVSTRAKLFPYQSETDALDALYARAATVRSATQMVDLRKAPKWVRLFFHPETLREVWSWFKVLQAGRDDFLLGCLLGILHHQRPGFLSYPSSHAVPYLRSKKFPRNDFPHLYEYRSVMDRLEKKVARAYRRVPELDYALRRQCYMHHATDRARGGKVNSIITSPPYMRQLDYGRDNRLRLWFLGFPDWRSLDKEISPGWAEFVVLLRQCLLSWRKTLVQGGLCILVLGNTRLRAGEFSLPELAVKLATQDLRCYSLVETFTDQIPNKRRIRRGYNGTAEETIVILRNEYNG